MHLESREPGVNVGIGTISEISELSAWKRSALGLLPYLGAALLVFALTGLLGATFARLLRIGIPAPLSATCAIGLAAMLVFFAYAVGPEFDYGAAFVALLILATGGAMFAMRDALRDTARELAPAAGVWVLGALAYFFLSGMAYNGLGHWEPAFRFSPAVWSSDNELPWAFAEGLRNDANLAQLFGGNWLPTDRPPLMAGMHLMLGDLFTLLQSSNDGAWLRGSTYNTAAIAASTLWLPVFFALLVTLFKLDTRRALQATLIAACVPFFVFNLDLWLAEVTERGVRRRKHLGRLLS